MATRFSRLLLIAVALPLGAATAAFAADLPVKVPAVPAQFSWTGCYIGGHMGGAFRDLTETNTLGASTTHSSAGFVGGAQIGCDYQFAPGWLLGVDGRAAWTGLKSSIAGSLTNSTGVVLPSQFTATNDFLASATGRLGYSFFDRRLLFVKGGVAWTSEKADVAFTTLQGLAVDPSSSATLTGWTAGIGSEWAFAPSWSVSLETDYYDFGGRSLRLTAPNATVISNFNRDGILTVTAGLNYRF